MTGHDDGSQNASTSRDIQQAIESITEGSPAEPKDDGVKEIKRLGANHPLRNPQSGSQPQKQKRDWLDKTKLIIQAILCLATIAAFCAAYWYAGIASAQRKTMDGQWAIMIAQWNYDGSCAR
jgi:hypothetical protein